MNLNTFDYLFLGTIALSAFVLWLAVRK